MKSSWFRLLPLVVALLAAGFAHAAGPDHARSVGQLEYSDTTVDVVENYVRQKERIQGLRPPEEKPVDPGLKGKDRLDEFERSVQRILERPGAPATTDGEKRPRPTVEEEFVRILEEERARLSLEDQAALEDPVDLTGARVEVPSPYEMVHVLSAGFERDRYESEGFSPITTNNTYMTLVTAYDRRLSEETIYRIDNTFTTGSLRTADQLKARIDHKLIRRWDVAFESAVDLERYSEDLAREDFFLFNGAAEAVAHLPESIDLALRYFAERQTFDHPDSEIRDSLIKLQDVLLIKYLEEGDIRFRVTADQQRFPDDPELDFQRIDLVAGFRTVVNSKYDFDYTYDETHEKVNLPPTPNSNYDQETHTLLNGIRFSRETSLELLLEWEGREYAGSDVVNLSYSRTLWNPALRWRITDDLQGSVGFLENTILHRQFGELEDLIAAHFDYRDQRATLDLTYTKGRMSASAFLSGGSRHYLHFQDTLQSDYDIFDLSLNTQYDFTPNLGLFSAYTRSRQAFDLSPIDDNVTTYFTANLSWRF